MMPQTDGVMPYIDWAIAHGFGVMDVNMPMANLNAEVRPPGPNTIFP